jgi:uncharacterized RDD family membrane protein YckC
MNYAGFWKRCFAGLIDDLIFSVFIFSNVLLFYHLNNSLYYFISASISLVELFYDILFVYYKGATPGRMALGIKVLRTDGSKVTLYNTILRELFSIISLLIFVIANLVFNHKVQIWLLISQVYFYVFLGEYFMFFFNDMSKTLHDYIADTVVIDSKKQKMISKINKNIRNNLFEQEKDAEYVVKAKGARNNKINIEESVSKIKNAGDLRVFILDLISEYDNDFIQSLDKYLLTFLSTVHKYKSEIPSYQLIGRIFEQAFVYQPVEFDDDWLQINPTRFIHLEPHPKDFDNLLVNKETNDVVSKFEVLEKTLMFQIADLKRISNGEFEIKGENDTSRMVSSSGSIWVSTDTINYLKYSIYGLFKDTETQCDWLTLTDLIDYGRRGFYSDVYEEDIDSDTP